MIAATDRNGKSSSA